MSDVARPVAFLGWRLNILTFCKRAPRSLPRVALARNFCKSTEWATLLTCERYPNYREAPPQESLRARSRLRLRYGASKGATFSKSIRNDSERICRYT